MNKTNNECTLADTATDLTIENPGEAGGAVVKRDGEEIGSVLYILHHPEEFIAEDWRAPGEITRLEYSVLEFLWETDNLERWADSDEDS